MRPGGIRAHRTKQPFEPFRLHLSDSEVSWVSHPDMCLIGRSALYVVIPDARRPWMYERLAHCALIHITRIEPIDGRGRPTQPRKGGLSE